MAQFASEAEEYDPALQLLATTNKPTTSPHAQRRCYACDPVQLRSYATAVDILDATGKAFIENNLLKFRAKDQFLNAVICHMAAGVCMSFVSFSAALPTSSHALPRTGSLVLAVRWVRPVLATTTRIQWRQIVL